MIRRRALLPFAVVLKLGCAPWTPATCAAYFFKYGVTQVTVLRQHLDVLENSRTFHDCSVSAVVNLLSQRFRFSQLRCVRTQGHFLVRTPSLGGEERLGHRTCQRDAPGGVCTVGWVAERTPSSKQQLCHFERPQVCAIGRDTPSAQTKLPRSSRASEQRGGARQCGQQSQRKWNQPPGAETGRGVCRCAGHGVLARGASVREVPAAESASSQCRATTAGSGRSPPRLL